MMNAKAHSLSMRRGRKAKYRSCAKGDRTAIVELRGAGLLELLDETAIAIDSEPLSFVTEFDHRLVGYAGAIRARMTLPSPSPLPFEGPIPAPISDPEGPHLVGTRLEIATLADDQTRRRFVEFARIRLARQEGCSCVVVCKLNRRVPWSNSMSPAAYLQQVSAGAIQDPVLGIYLDAGFRPRVIEPVDRDEIPRVLLVWDNPVRG